MEKSSCLFLLLIMNQHFTLTKYICLLRLRQSTSKFHCSKHRVENFYVGVFFLLPTSENFTKDRDFQKRKTPYFFTRLCLWVTTKTPTKQLRRKLRWKYYLLLGKILKSCVMICNCPQSLLFYTLTEGHNAHVNMCN